MERDILRKKSFLLPHVNPFVHEVNLTVPQKIQVFFMSLTIAPIRIIMVSVLMVFGWTLAFFSTLGMGTDFRTPAPAWRQILFQITALIGRLQFFFMGFLWVKVKGKRASSKDVKLFTVAPHSSFFDAVIWFCTVPVPACVSRMENAHTPIIGTLIRILQPILVSRHDPQSRQNTIHEIKRRASAVDWPQIIIFPEGTCTNRKALITFKGGAFIPGVPVQPVIIRYPNALDTFTWTMKGPGGLKLLWLSLCQFYNRCEVEFLPVYEPDENEIKDPKLFAENVRLTMADALDIPCTDHTFEDCRLMDQAHSHSLPMEAGLVEFSKLSRKLGLKMDVMKDLLDEYAAISKTCKDGVMGIEEFAKHLKLPVTEALQQMFNLYDRDGSGKLDFREYVIGMSLVSHSAVTEESVKLAFKVFDQDSDGNVSRDEFNHALKSVFGPDFNAEGIFTEIDTGNKNMVGYDEFYAFAKKRPEYARLFMSYSEETKSSFLAGQKNENGNSSKGLMAQKDKDE